MTALAWLQSRTPPPPPALNARLLDALGKEIPSADRDVSETCLAAAVRLLEQLLDDDATGRESAVDLLTADALVTYAFEAAAEDVASLERRTGEAMRRLAALSTRSDELRA